ncbi:MAG: hypothetical protein ACK55Z_09255, partial [bacterium]
TLDLSDLSDLCVYVRMYMYVYVYVRERVPRRRAAWGCKAQSDKSNITHVCGVCVSVHYVSARRAESGVATPPARIP